MQVLVLKPKGKTKLVRDIPNTFAPNVNNKMLHEGDIFMGLKYGVFKYEKLPESVKERVDKYEIHREIL